MQQFLEDYSRDITDALALLDSSALSDAVEVLRKAHRRKATVFVAGNGGSAGSANHFVCDFGKNAIRDDENRFRVISVSDNVEKITALGNDIGFESIFEEQLKNLMDSGDVLIAVTASGNSPDIVRAVEYARKKGGTVIGITGFEGGEVRKSSDVSIHIPLDSYEKIEDVHLIVLHMIVYWFRENQDEI